MALSGGEIQTLRTELQDDPLAKGYSAMTDEAVAIVMNGVTQSADKDTITAKEAQASVVGSEYLVLTDAQRDAWAAILSDDIDIKNTNIRNQIAEIWAAGTATRTNLVDLQTKSVSRAEELGIGTVKPGDVQIGRA